MPVSLCNGTFLPLSASGIKSQVPQSPQKPQGLHITAIQKFIKDHPNIQKHSLTTSQISKDIVKPETKGTASCYLRKYANRSDRSTGKPYTAPATVFVSHAWQYSFSAVVADVLERFADENPDSYFWFDLFSNDQNDMWQRDFEWFCTTFSSSITEIGHFLLVLSPWDNPIPITRSWCLFEIYTALHNPNVRFSVSLPKNEVVELKSSVMDDSKCLVQALALIQAENGNAKHQSDKETIDKSIQSGDGGFTKVNIQIKNGLRKWYVAQLLQLTDEEPTNHQLIINSANVMREFGFLETAMSLYEKALNIRIENSEKMHDVIATCYNNMALIYHTQDNFSQALNYYQKSLEIRQKQFGENHATVAESYNNIGNVYCAERSLDDALSYYEKALKISKGLNSEHSDIVATCYNNIASVYTYQGQLQKAKEFDDKSNEIRSVRYGDNHPGIATAYISKGNRCFIQKDPTQADKHYKKALNILLQTYGEKHHDVASVYSNIANVAYSVGNYDEAIQNYELSIDISVKALGNDSLHIADIYNNMAELYARKGLKEKFEGHRNASQDFYAQSLSYHEQCLVIRTNKLDTNNPSIANSLFNIGNAHSNLGNFDKALQHHVQAQTIRLKIFDEKHPDVIDSYKHLALLYEAKGKKSYESDSDNKNGLKFYEEALKTCEKIPADTTAIRVSCYENMAKILAVTGETSKAVESLKHSLAAQAKLGRICESGVSFREIISIFLKDQHFIEALDYLNELLGLRQSFLGSDHPIVTGLTDSIADVYARKGDLSKALEYLNKSLNSRMNYYGGFGHLEVAVTLEMIAKVYEAKHDYDSAWEYVEKALNVRVAKRANCDQEHIERLNQFKTQLMRAMDQA